MNEDLQKKSFLLLTSAQIPMIHTPPMGSLEQLRKFGFLSFDIVELQTRKDEESKSKDQERVFRF